MRVPLERKVLNENDRIAATLRQRFRQCGAFCLNLISSPGSGKTTLLERTLAGYDCHLDASMVERHLADWKLDDLEILFLENVGNLVCPTSYDLGEDARAVLLSVTEGEDKPLKYPATFHHADLMLLTKTDLLPYVPFDMEQARENARRVQPGIEILDLSCTSGDGLDRWYAWIERHL
jgi:hydrogenase nickel incorporation protein HypB